MIEDIRQNRTTLKNLLEQIQVTDAQKKTVAFEQATESVIQMILKQNEKGKKIIFIGNGGSAAIASHMATDFWKNAGIKAIAFNDGVLLTCLSNDCGYEAVFEKSIEMFAESGDVLIAISSSGKSQNILRAVDAAGPKAMHIITFSGFAADNPLRKKGEVNFYVPSAEYGHVEVLHHSICHLLIDVIIKNKTKTVELRLK